MARKRKRESKQTNAGREETTDEEKDPTHQRRIRGEQESKNGNDMAWHATESISDNAIRKTNHARLRLKTFVEKSDEKSYDKRDDESDDKSVDESEDTRGLRQTT